MAPPRKHPTDAILDAARRLAIVDGPRAVSIAAIAEASGAPSGTLYHRFGSRDGILVAAWLRALERFQALALAAISSQDDPVDTGVALAGATLRFAVKHEDDARLLLVLRRADLLDRGDLPPDRLDEINAPLADAIRRVTRALHGRADARALDAVTRAVIDLPTAAVRRHLREPGGRVPDWLVADVAAEVRALLT